MLITIGAAKTSDDTVHFIYMYDYYGGTVVVGKQKDGQVTSRAKSLNGKKIKWTADNSFMLGNKNFIRFDKTTSVEKNSFKEMLGKYCYGRGQDSLAIVTGGP